MANVFSPRTVITNPADLFGRQELLEQLITLANNRYSVSITGLRRFGKTSLLKCVETSLRKNPSSKVYPIFIDFKEVGSIVKGTDNVYKYIISCFVATLTKDKHFVGELTFKKKVLTASSEWEDTFESLHDINAVRIQGLFEEVFLFFSEYLEKTILLLIDEYEWLFKFSFDQPVGFMKLRNFSSKLSSTGINPLSFWVVGATPWDYLCTLTGSGELNVIDAPPIHLGPIDYTSFQLMWQSDLRTLENVSELVKSSGDFAFQASGGIPFFGKLIGSFIVSNNFQPTHIILKSYLQELLDSLQSEERTILNELANSPRNYKSSKFIHELIDKGIIINNSTGYEIKISFLREFIKSTQFSSGKTNNLTVPECQLLTDNITNLIANINKTNKNKKGSYIFEPVVDEASLIKDMRTACYSPELFSDFASSLYKIVFERTKDDRNGNDLNKAKLPSSFKKNNQFIEIVDIMRHSLGGGHLMDKFSQRNGQITKARMLEILTGSNNEPNSADEFYKLQISTLKLFEAELIRLNNIVRSSS